MSAEEVSPLITAMRYAAGEVPDKPKPPVTTSTPSDAAMAAAKEICAFFSPCKTAQKYDVEDVAPIIDRHFAQLREELARLTVESERQRGHHIDIMIELGGCQLERMALRASNDKLRAALEKIVEYTAHPVYLGGWSKTHCRYCAEAALAPERKETT